MITKFANVIKKNATWLKKIGIIDLPIWIYIICLLHGLFFENNGFKIMLANNQCVNKFKDKKKELNFDFELK